MTEPNRPTTTTTTTTTDAALFRLDTVRLRGNTVGPDSALMLLQRLQPILRGELPLMATAVAEQDYKTLQYYLHRNHSVCLYLGIVSISERANAMKAHLDELEWPVVQAGWPDLLAACEAFLAQDEAALRAWIQAEQPDWEERAIPPH